MSALSGKPVISEFFTANTGSWNSHVDLGLWADAMVIAPATASTIAKMANGVADNMLITTYLSAKAPVFIAPAMDLDMYAHPSTQHNLTLLREYGNHIIEPASGELASHLVGKGRMEEPERILEIVDDFFGHSEDLSCKHVIVTAGPTYEKIDPVRFIGNYSSGKMGYAIAENCASRGATVTLISGPVSIKAKHPSIKVINVESAVEMYNASVDIFPSCDVAVMCAAVADYAVENQSIHKIKRDHDDVPVIKLKKNPDIAAKLGNLKKDNQILVGFALETDNEEANAAGKLRKKNLDFIVLNSLSDKGAGFMTDTNKITIIDNTGSVKHYGLKDKKLVAEDVVNEIIARMQ